MIYRGRVHQGMVVFDQPTGLQDGVPVQVEVVDSGDETGHVAESPSLYDRLQDLIGQAQDLPPDASQQIDHYLYGTPKRP
jgi:hypothetical protein